MILMRSSKCKTSKSTSTIQKKQASQASATRWVKSKEIRLHDVSWHHTYTFKNGDFLLCYRSNNLGPDWHINVAYRSGGNIFNSGHCYVSLKKAKDATMRAYIAYFALNVMGKWDKQKSFMTQEWPSEDTSLRFKPLWGIYNHRRV